MRRLMTCALAALCVAVWATAGSALTVVDLNTPGMTARDLAQTLMPGVVTSNERAVLGGAPLPGVSDVSAVGIFSGGLADGLGVDAGIMLSTGLATSATLTPNLSVDQASFALGLPGDADLQGLFPVDLCGQDPPPLDCFTADAAVLEFDFVPTGNAATFRFVFASEELCDLGVCGNTPANDIFAIFVNGVNVATVPGTTLPVSVFNIDMNSPLFNDNFTDVSVPPNPPASAFPTPYDGFTTVFTATARVTPGVTNHVKIAIADGFDEFIDSAAFLEPAVLARVSQVGVYRGGRFILDMNGNGVFESGIDRAFTFGLPTDKPVAGDWNGDGATEVGVYRSGRFILDMNGNGVFESGIDRAFTFGLATDLPVTGDWNGDGVTDVGVYRSGRFILDMNGNGVFESGIDRAFTFGLATDLPVTGDWNGDGVTDVGVYRSGRFILDMNGNGVFESGIDRAFTFGLATDLPVTGVW